MTPSILALRYHAEQPEEASQRERCDTQPAYVYGGAGGLAEVSTPDA